MRILVIDDNDANLAAAKAQLGIKHSVTVANSYEEGQQLLWKKHQFDVVLVDLLMPGKLGACRRSEESYGKEMPIGIFLALLAAKHGAQYVGVLTDSDHHAHPASACFDAFNAVNAVNPEKWSSDGPLPKESAPIPFLVEGAKVSLCNNRNWIRFFDSKDLSKPMDWKKYYALPGECSETVVKPGTVRAKHWQAFLDYLLDPKVEKDGDI